MSQRLGGTISPIAAARRAENRERVRRAAEEEEARKAQRVADLEAERDELLEALRGLESYASQLELLVYSDRTGGTCDESDVMHRARAVLARMEKETP